MICDSFFFFNDSPTTEIYTLSLHDALPIFLVYPLVWAERKWASGECDGWQDIESYELDDGMVVRSEEHTSELQSHSDLVCRLLLEKKKRINPKDRDCSWLM